MQTATGDDHLPAVHARTGGERMLHRLTFQQGRLPSTMRALPTGFRRRARVPQYLPEGGDQPHLVILGGGFGGLNGAKGLHGAPVRVTLVDQHTVSNLLRQLNGEPTESFSYRDRGMMATIGRGRAVATIADRSFDGLGAWLLWAVVHVWSLIEFHSRVAVMPQWGWAFLTGQRTACLITGKHASKRTYISLANDRHDSSPART